MQEESSLKRFLYPDKKTRYGIQCILCLMFIALLIRNYYLSKPVAYTPWTIITQPEQKSLPEPTSVEKININESHLEQWESLGLSKKQSQLLIQFLQKKKPVDWHTLRTFKYVPNGFWDRHKNRIIFPKRQALLSPNHGLDHSLAKLELNAAGKWQLEQTGCFDSLTLKQFFILRKRLGGFSNPMQVFDIKDIDSTCIAGHFSTFYADTSRIRKIKINYVDVSVLQRHPYLNRGIASALINYRNNHGFYKNGTELMQCYGMNENLLKKLLPYLSFDL